MNITKCKVPIYTTVSATQSIDSGWLTVRGIDMVRANIYSTVSGTIAINFSCLGNVTDKTYTYNIAASTTLKITDIDDMIYDSAQIVVSLASTPSTLRVFVVGIE